MANIERGGEREPLSESGKLKESGIAQRMVDSIKKYRGENDPEIIFGVEDCNFSVEQMKRMNPKTKKYETHTQAIIQMPNLKRTSERDSLTVQRGFGVEKGKSFGAASEAPLTDEQFELIQEIIKEKQEAKKNEENIEKRPLYKAEGKIEEKNKIG
jgi:hypothetical protein